MRVGEEFTESEEMMEKVREKSMHRQRREVKERIKRQSDIPRGGKKVHPNRKSMQWDEADYN